MDASECVWIDGELRNLPGDVRVSPVLASPEPFKCTPARDL